MICAEKFITLEADSGRSQLENVSSCSSVIIDDRNRTVSVCHWVNSLLEKFPDLNVSVCYPIWSQCSDDSLYSWKLWNRLRSCCNYNQNLRAALVMCDKVPDDVVERWSIEPLSHIFLPGTLFVENSLHRPVLRKATQLVAARILQANFLCPPRLSLKSCSSEIPQEYIQQSEKYLTYLYRKRFTLCPLSPIQTTILSHNVGSKTLQTPLEPLSHNLEAPVYETFEKDTAKYDCYELATLQALVDLRHKAHIHICIIGAGRGGIVSRVVKLVRGTGKVTITAVEKNPIAIPFLLRTNEQEWEKRVNVIEADSREWIPELLPDLVISELLGSFGCNELSPECIYPIPRHKDTIFIPQKYESFVCPVMAPQIFSKCTKDVTCVSTGNPVEFMCDKFASCWTFSHPGNSSSNRTADVCFDLEKGGVIHGLMGCFDSVLYKDIVISNNPIKTVPQNLIGWFPFYMPFQHPLNVDRGKIQVHVERVKRDQRCWYEWSASSGKEYTLVHNSNGRGSFVSL